MLMDNLQYLGTLHSRSSFSRDDLGVAMNDCGMLISEVVFKSKLQRLINSGKIVRIGRNEYCIPSDGLRIPVKTLSRKLSIRIRLSCSGLTHMVNRLIKVT